VVAVSAWIGLASTAAFAGVQGHASPASHATHPTKSVQHHTPIPVAQRITNNPALAARLQPLLPSGTTLASASDGFKSEGQFIAALHAAQDLKIPFAQLKAEMTGTDHDSLGKAIHDLQPTADAKAAAKTADEQARADIKATRPAPVAFGQRLANNPALVARLQPLLPSGMTIATAADGFRNEGQFIAALHAAQDLKISFAQLKAEMTGTPHDSLGQAIHDLQPTANAKAAATTAEQEARADIRATRPVDTDDK